MKRIETLTPNDRLAVVRTLNDAALNGDVSYSCQFGIETDCKVCPLSFECGSLYIRDFSKKSFNGWLTWLVEEVEKPAIRSGYRVIYTEHSNIFFIVRPDGTNLYAKGRPMVLLSVDLQRYSEFVISDVFSSRYGDACILVEDTKNGEMRFYSNILL